LSNRLTEQSSNWCCGGHEIVSNPYWAFSGHLRPYNYITSKHLMGFTCSLGHSNKILEVALFFQKLSTSLDQYPTHIYSSLYTPSYVLIWLYHSINSIFSEVSCTFPFFHQGKSLPLTEVCFCQPETGKLYYRIPGDMNCFIYGLTLRWWLIWNFYFY
jgi:hypothetical protein